MVANYIAIFLGVSGALRPTDCSLLPERCQSGASREVQPCASHHSRALFRCEMDKLTDPSTERPGASFGFQRRTCLRSHLHGQIGRVLPVRAWETSAAAPMPHAQGVPEKGEDPCRVGAGPIVAGLAPDREMPVQWFRARGRVLLSRRAWRWDV